MWEIVSKFIVQLLTQPLTFGLRSLGRTFMPAYFDAGGWYNLGADYSQPLALVCAFYWVLPFGRPHARAVSFCLMLAHFYLTYISGAAPWYMPPVTLLSIFVLYNMLHQARGAASLLQDKVSPKVYRGVVAGIRACAWAVFLVSACIMLAAAYQFRLDQIIVEDGNRKQIGLWLKEHASKNDTVALEPSGYIGYFSGLKLYDYQGLSSDEVISLRSKLASGRQDSFAELIRGLRPVWLVLRPSEVGLIQQEDPQLLAQHYQVAKIFDVSGAIKKVRFLPGRNFLYGDQYFTVFKIKK